MIKKAVIPAAGFGSRLLPATKCLPKEMLPIIDKPTIQYIIEECVAAGIQEVLLIISKGKEALVDHFRQNEVLDEFLAQKGKEHLNQELNELINKCKVSFIYQEEMKGLGHAIGLAESFTKDEPFLVLLGDTIVESFGPTTLVQEMVSQFSAITSSMVAVEEVALEHVSKYGVVSGQSISDSIRKLDGLVEKPTPAAAPSNLVIAGRYIFTPTIYRCIEKVKLGYGGEYQLTDAMHLLLTQEDMYSYQFNGQRHDMGNPVNYLKTTLAIASRRPEFADLLKGLNLEQVRNS